MKWYSIGITLCLILLTMQGILAESLVSFDMAVKPDPYATDDLISRAGTINFPAGIGIVTVNEIIQPYWAPKGDILPIRVEFSRVNAKGPIASIEDLGMDVYQFGNEVPGLDFSNGVPLKIVKKQIVNSSETIPYYVLLRNSLDKDESIHEFNLVYSAEYEPISYNHTAYQSGNPSGAYKTTLGTVNLTFSDTGWFPYLNGTFADGSTIGGTINGPIWFGMWNPDYKEVEDAPSKAAGGQFMVRFNEDWSAFSGTKGNWHSASNAGSFTGEKVLV